MIRLAIFHRTMRCKLIFKVAESFFHYMQDLLHIKNRGFEFWNGPIETFQPALNVFTKPRPEGFTAVILTYDRFDYMIKVIQRLVVMYLELP